MNVHFSSKTDDWYTPDEVFKPLCAEFDLQFDVCADVDNTKFGINHYDKEEDGLKQDWSHSRCWMNPPYGREIGKWVKKAAESGTLVVALLPARTDTKWFHDYILGKAEIRFIKGRLKFGGCKNSAPFPSMIVIFKSQPLKPMTKELPPTGEWEEEFDQIYGKYWIASGNNGKLHVSSWHLKPFIRKVREQSLQEGRESALREVEAALPEKLIPAIIPHHNPHLSGFNECHAKVLEALSKLRKV